MRIKEFIVINRINLLATLEIGAVGPYVPKLSICGRNPWFGIGLAEGNSSSNPRLQYIYTFAGYSKRLWIALSYNHAFWVGNLKESILYSISTMSFPPSSCAIDCHPISNEEIHKPKFPEEYNEIVIVNLSSEAKGHTIKNTRAPCNSRATTSRFPAITIEGIFQDIISKTERSL